MKSVQRGGAAMIALIGVVGFALMLTIGVVLTYVKWANYGNQTENHLESIWENNKNISGQYAIKLQEIAQVPKMYQAGLKDVVESALKARYGADGNKATVAFLQEHAINFDPSMYSKIQQVIESGRNEFQSEQTRLIDAKNAYKNNLGDVWSGFWLKQAGYPKVDLAKYKPVVAATTDQEFKAGVQEPINLLK